MMIFAKPRVSPFFAVSSVRPLGNAYFEAKIGKYCLIKAVRNAVSSVRNFPLGIR